jgi:hypothetical protein
MRRPATQQPTTELLTASQHTVLQQLLLGKTATQAAEIADVDRSTVYRWMREDYQFIAAYNRARQDLFDAAHTRLLKLGEAAIETIETRLTRGDSRVAIMVLRGLGLLSGTSPIGSGDPEALRAVADQAAREREHSDFVSLLSDRLR